MNTNTKKEKILLALGIIFIAIGVLVNPWIAGKFLSYKNTLSGFDAFFLGGLDVVGIAAGALLIWRRRVVAAGFGKKNILLLFSTLVILFLAAELGARSIDKLHGGDFLSNASRAEKPIIPFRMFGFDLYQEKNGIRYISSRHGELYPFKKDPNTFRIVAFGGSTTQNVADGEHYPLVLEHLLQERYPQKHVEVINIGNSGYSTPHLIILLALDVLSWKPDLIIASENINDLLASYFPDFTPDYSNKYSTSSFLPKPSAAHALFGWSRLYWIIRSRLDVLSLKFDYWLGVVYHRKSYGMNPPQESQDVFRRNWETFVSIAQANHIPVILASQPLEPSEEYWNRHMQYKTYNDVAVYPLHPEFVSHHHVFNTIIEEVAKETHSYFVDNDTSFYGDREFFIDFVHYTKTGVEKLAHNYFDFIVSQKLIR